MEFLGREKAEMESADRKQRQHPFSRLKTIFNIAFAGKERLQNASPLLEIAAGFP